MQCRQQVAAEPVPNILIVVAMDKQTLNILVQESLHEAAWYVDSMHVVRPGSVSDNQTKVPFLSQGNRLKFSLNQLDVLKLVAGFRKTCNCQSSRFGSSVAVASTVCNMEPLNARKHARKIHRCIVSTVSEFGKPEGKCFQSMNMVTGNIIRKSVSIGSDCCNAAKSCSVSVFLMNVSNSRVRRCDSL